MKLQRSISRVQILIMWAIVGVALRSNSGRGPVRMVTAFSIAASSMAAPIGRSAASSMASSSSSPWSTRLARFGAAAASSSGSRDLGIGVDGRTSTFSSQHAVGLSSTARAFALPANRWARVGGSTALLSSTAAAIEDDTSANTQSQLEHSMHVTHPAYDVLQRDVVTEYGAYCTLYKHKQSGAELLSVAVDDDNKVFGITFRTPPSDSTGVPHILEHSVLCGSRKYTTKDPFVHLLKGSLQTFLNAFTYPDRTCYVVASQNVKDFYNLINVYADAVLHPRAIQDPMVLAQEGWHLELEDKEAPLTYKGVVYNEMKGVYSSPDALLGRASQRSIFPDNTYAVDSGGDPRAIPDLTFDQFRDFHGKFYHPSNARIYFSGDDDVYKRLELMDEYLKDFRALPNAAEESQIVWQPKTFKEPQRMVQTYPTGADQPETHSVMINWLLNDKPFTSFEELTLGLLDHLMMGTTSAILRKTLMESGLGDAITGRGVADELMQATFSVGLKGVKADDVAKVEQLILDTIAKIENDGFEDDDIAAALNTVEFELREFNTGSFPRGLSFMLGSMSKWLYGNSPTDALKFEGPLAQLKATISESGSKVFKDMVRSFLLENTHRTTLELVPSKTMEEELLRDEQERLEKIKSSLSDAELEQIIQTTETLKAMQAAEDPPEARSTIPSLELSDLKRETTEYPIAVTENENDSGIAVIRHELTSTSGIAYVVMGVDLSRLALEDVPLLPLFTKLMTEAGAGEYDQVALSRKIGTHTGGVDVNLMTSAVYEAGVDADVLTSGENLVTRLLIQGKATSGKMDELFGIMKLILTEGRLDSQARAIELLKETRSRLESRIQGAGHSVANTRMKARYRVGAFLDETMSGVTYLETVKQLLKQAQEDWPSLLARLERVRHTILDEDHFRSGAVLDITADKDVFEAAMSAVHSFLGNLPGKKDGAKRPDYFSEKHPWVVDAKKKMSEMVPIVDEGFVVPTQVSYVGKSGLLYREGERIPGSAAVVARFLRTGYLWDHVRVMGGAYGGFCTFSPSSGFFSFLSYRDPNLQKTLDVYDAAADALMAAADVMEEDRAALEAAIIGTIGDMDNVLSPDQKGFTSFTRWLTNESPEYRQKYRDEILNTKPSDFREFAQRLKNLKKPSIAVVSSKAAFESAAQAGRKMTLREIY